MPFCAPTVLIASRILSFRNEVWLAPPLTADSNTVSVAAHSPTRGGATLHRPHRAAYKPKASRRHHLHHLEQIHVYLDIPLLRVRKRTRQGGVNQAELGWKISVELVVIGHVNGNLVMRMHLPQD